MLHLCALPCAGGIINACVLDISLVAAMAQDGKSVHEHMHRAAGAQQTYSPEDEPACSSIPAFSMHDDCLERAVQLHTGTSAAPPPPQAQDRFSRRSRLRRFRGATPSGMNLEQVRYMQEKQPIIEIQRPSKALELLEVGKAARAAFLSVVL